MESPKIRENFVRIAQGRRPYGSFYISQIMS